MLRATALVLIATAESAKVAVIGGGFAGLGAATEAQASGHAVTLFEARDRLGGRAYTDSSALGYAVDLGAMWIHGIAGNPLYALAQKYGVATAPTDYDNLELFSPSGELVPDAPVEAAYTRLSKAIESYRDEHNNDDDDYSLGVAMEAAFESLGLTQAEQDMMRFKICDEIELDYSASVYNLSGWWFDSDSWLLGGDVLVNDTDGFGALVAGVAGDLSETEIRLNTSISQVEYDSDRFTLSTHDGDTAEFDYVVVTASLGVLKRDDAIEFSPALPKRIRKAIARLGCDVSDKLVLEFASGTSELWNGTALDVFYHIDQEPELHGTFTENWNIKHFQPTADHDVLMSFSVGARDWSLVEHADDEQVVAAAMTALRSALPTLPDPTRHAIHRWGADPLAACSWSSWAVGSSPKDTAAFLAGADDGRLLFAGEHTTQDAPGTTHGAWETGLSAAKAIQALEARRGLESGAETFDIAAFRAQLHKPDPERTLLRQPLRSRRKHRHHST